METVIEQKETETGLVSMISNHLSQSQMPTNGLNLSEMSTENLHPSDTSDTLDSADRHSYTWCILLCGAPAAKALKDSTLPLGPGFLPPQCHTGPSDLHVAEAESRGHMAANPYKLKEEPRVKALVGERGRINICASVFPNMTSAC